MRAVYYIIRRGLFLKITGFKSLNVGSHGAKISQTSAFVERSREDFVRILAQRKVSRLVQDKGELHQIIVGPNNE